MNRRSWMKSLAAVLVVPFAGRKQKLTGTVDEVAYYGRALSSAEVRDIQIKFEADTTEVQAAIRELQRAMDGLRPIARAY